MNTDINESGPLVSQKNIDELNKRLLETMQNCSVLVLTGSLPQNVDRGIYGLWAEKAKQSGVKVVIDAERDVLKHGIEASPYVVKPNIFELEELFGQKTDCIDDVVKLAQRIFEYDVKIVVVSLGEKGALFVKRDAIILAQAISVNPKSTVGAGDSMVAALTLAIEKNYDFEKAVKLAVACGTASVMTPGTQAADMDTILEYEKQVSFEYLQ
jgi:1-phosphofructokinase